MDQINPIGMGAMPNLGGLGGMPNMGMGGLQNGGLMGNGGIMNTNMGSSLQNSLNPSLPADLITITSSISDQAAGAVGMANNQMNQDANTVNSFLANVRQSLGLNPAAGGGLPGAAALPGTGQKLR